MVTLNMLRTLDEEQVFSKDNFRFEVMPYR